MKRAARVAAFLVAAHLAGEWAKYFERKADTA